MSGYSDATAEQMIQLFFQHLERVETAWTTVQDREATYTRIVEAKFRAEGGPTIPGTTVESVVSARSSVDPIIRSAKSRMDRNQKFAVLYGLASLIQLIRREGKP